MLLYKKLLLMTFGTTLVHYIILKYWCSYCSLHNVVDVCVRRQEPAGGLLTKYIANK